MGRIGWAFIGLTSGAVVGFGLAFFVAKDTGHFPLKLALVITIGVALAVLGWAHSAGVTKEPESPPELSLGPAVSSRPAPPESPRARRSDVEA